MIFSKDHSRNIITELDRERDDRRAGWISLLLSAALVGLLFWMGV